MTTPLPVSRQGWPPGPWDDEPDRDEWIDAATGLRCMLLRTPEIGSLCGYVAVQPGHPLYGASRDAARVLSVHGGVTFADRWDDDDDSRAWWIGFDCGHAWDDKPYFARLGLQIPGCEYRTIAYVREQCSYLAAQLAAMRGRVS